MKPKNKEEKKEERRVQSLESQEKELREFAKQSGYKVVKVFKENQSAYKTGRPQFQEMMQMFEDGKADSILVCVLSRISRNTWDGGKVIYYLDEGLIKRIITPKKVYQDSGEDKFILSIELAMAKKSSDDTSNFVCRDIKAKADRGEFPGNAPLGYLNIDKEGRIAGVKFDAHKQLMLEEMERPLKRIEIDPVMGELVKSVFYEAAKGIHTLNELCELAYKIGVRAPRSGKKIVKATLQRILTNPFYCGKYIWENKLYSDDVKHDTLINEQLFDQVQAALGKKTFKKKEKETYKFSSLMACSECGSTISSQVQKGIRYYHCSHYRAKKAGEKCSQKKVCD